MTVAFHVGIVVLYNVVGFHLSTLVVERAGTAGQSRFFERLRHLGHVTPIAVYARYTGIATGYGFYAPHVASPYVIEVAARPAAVGKCDTLTRPEWARGAGAVRYRAFTSTLRHLLPREQRLYETDTLDIRYTRVLARQAALGIAQTYGAHAVSWRTYVVGLPRLRARHTAYATTLIDEHGTTSIPAER
ncbi:MAG TPA: hypothetical protein VKZ71_09045 [Burkholderiaceae bacterium]|nr:hypothetical protein [Burkholderiaceae bacterium]